MRMHATIHRTASKTGLAVSAEPLSAAVPPKAVHRTGSEIEVRARLFQVNIEKQLQFHVGYVRAHEIRR